MSVKVEDGVRVGQEQDFDGFDKKCALCERPATAFWAGRRGFSICENCAQEIFPAILVDAITLRAGRDAADAEAAWHRAAGRFWHAFGLRLARELRLAGRDAQIAIFEIRRPPISR